MPAQRAFRTFDARSQKVANDVFAAARTYDRVLTASGPHGVGD